MLIIFCCDPMDNKKVDLDYLSEFNEAKKNGFEVSLINIDELIFFDNLKNSIKSLSKQAHPTKAIYRGWMLKPNIYNSLYEGLKRKNIHLINNPTEYKACHYLPESYEIIKKYTPKSIWVEVDEFKNYFNCVFDKLRVFNNKPIIIKDYVKSRKHEWNDAFYIKDSSDKNELLRVVNNFIDRQGDNLNEGLIFREFINLEFLTNHSKSNMPLTKEYRVFVINNIPKLILNYWDEGEYDQEQLPINSFEEVIYKINSNFFTIDIAKKTDGDWSIIEIGDGQVSGLPKNSDASLFYKTIKSIFK